MKNTYAQKAEPDWGPTLVRLAWHSSGTYDRMSKTGGSGLGTMRFKEELAHGANAGLDKAVKKLEPIKAKHPDVSYADLYALSGVVAIETLGGPKVGFNAGRKDSMDPKDVTPDGRLPGADKGNPMKTASHLREVFGRMGFNDQEIVALAGAHALGRCHADASGYVGPWTPTPTTFNNLYFSLLVNLKWEPNVVNDHFQYKDPSGKLMMLPRYALVRASGAVVQHEPCHDCITGMLITWYTCAQHTHIHAYTYAYTNTTQRHRTDRGCRIQEVCGCVRQGPEGLLR